MEEGAINKPHETRQKAKTTLARSETFPSTSHPQRAINQQKSSSFPSFLTHSDQEASFIQQQPYVSNFESDSLTNHRQVANAGDASLEALWPLFVKLQPSLSSLPQDLVNWEAATLLPAPKFDEPQETSSSGKTSQDELEQIVSEEPSASKNFENETNRRERTLDEHRAQCGPLLQAAIKGDWPAAKAFLKKNPECVRAPITKERGTALHNAVVAQRTSFTKELLKLMDPDDLELRTIQGVTALHFAAQSGIVRIAEQLVKINNKPLLIPDCVGRKPLQYAAELGCDRNMVSYLFSVTPFEQLTADERTQLLHYTIYYDLYDIAVKILEMDPNIATVDTGCGWRALEELSKKPFAIGSESQLSFWKSRLNSWFKGMIYSKALTKTLAHQLVERIWKMVGILDKQLPSNLVIHNHMNLIFEAARVGNVEFLIILIRSYPDLIWQLDEKNMSIFHIAILYRQKSVFNLIYEIGTNKDTIATYYTCETEENMLHLAGRLPPSDRLNIVSGAALQMQLELLWFKEIEKIVPSSYVNMKNSNGQTPKEIFIRTHTDLQKEGEKWMKDTANYCMLVATLIATVIFAAAFTIPGGSNQETGTPIFLRSSWFMVFFISDAIALCSSSTSIVIFLSILTSRYTKEDFFKSLPSKLVLGLATLFISMAGMMVAFSATCFLVYNSTRVWAPIVVITSTSIPVTSFVLLHRKLWVDTFLSTYISSFLFRPYKHRIF